LTWTADGLLCHTVYVGCGKTSRPSRCDVSGKSAGRRDPTSQATADTARFEDFQEIMPCGGVERLKPPIIEDEKVGSAEVA
jgi:hypothetical protein